ncbi:MAG TPA: ATP-binding cassette domain-containing protein [Nitrososphaerales archaeon]|nr:ATP-binding cassette domain-containing protein [Nitrososphaerales archaeon]
MQDIIQTMGLWHEYPNGVEAIRNIDLTIQKGDYVALIGKNGSGKSTLVKHFNGLLRPTKGKVMVGGLDTVSTRSEKLATIVGYVFQNPDYMLFATTIEQEVEFGPKNLKLKPDEVNRRVDHALEVTGLAPLRKESPLFFGKGVRRMITITSILSMDPEVMVIDEPTTGMDYRGRESVMALIDRLNQLGKTIIIITHDMKVVAAHSKRVLVMSDGELILDSPTEGLFEHQDALAQASLKPPERIQLANEIGMKDNSGVPSIDDVSKKVREVILGSEKPET